MILKDSLNSAYKCTRVDEKNVPFYAKFDEGHYQDIKIDGNSCRVYSKYARSNNGYFKYNKEWFLTTKADEFYYFTSFRSEAYKPKQARKKYKKSAVKFNYNKGLSEGDKQEKNSCTVRAVCIGFNIPYKQAYELLANAGRQPNKGFFTEKLLVDGFTLNGYKVESYRRFTQRKANNDKFTSKLRPLTVREFLENYKSGRFILHIRQHAFAVVDGVVQDTFVKPKARVEQIFELKPVGDVNAD